MLEKTLGIARNTQLPLDAFIRQSHDIILRAQDVVFPPFCQLCDQPVRWPLRGGVCGSCIAQIPVVEHGCTRCGAELPDSVSRVEKPQAETLSPKKSLKPQNRGCPHCRRGKWPARRIYAFGSYGGTLAKILVLLKRPGSEPSAIALGNAMSQWFEQQRIQKQRIEKDPLETQEEGRQSQPPYDAIVSTPKYWMRRLLQRHNASDLLAEVIGLNLNAPVWTNGIIQTRPTSKQGILLASQRRENVAGAFAVNPAHRWQGKRILIVDDVVTSGSTIGEIASVLRRAKVASVDALCAARGVGAGGK